MSNQAIVVWGWGWGLHWTTIIVVVDAMDGVFLVNVVPSSFTAPTDECSCEQQEAEKAAENSSNDSPEIGGTCGRVATAVVETGRGRSSDCLDGG